MKFYTHFSKLGNQILVRGYKDGRRFNEKVEYNPTLYLLAGTKDAESKTKKSTKQFLTEDDML